jgi:hypothetical protein
VATAAADLQVLSDQAGRVLEPNGGRRARDDLHWAWLHLGAAAIGQTVVDRLRAGQLDPQLEAIFGQPWEILEVASMSLGFGDVMSALDLCADAVLLACGRPPRPNGRFYDLNDLRASSPTPPGRPPRPPLVAPPRLRAWIDQLLAHPDLQLLRDCRNPVVHQKLRRHRGVTMENGLVTGRALSEITTLHGQGPAQWRGSIGDLVPRLVGFGEAQLVGLCRAVIQTWGG